MQTPLSITVSRPRKRKAPVWVTLFPVAVSFLSLLAFGIFLTFSTLNTDSHISSTPIISILEGSSGHDIHDTSSNSQQSVSLPVSTLSSNVDVTELKGDIEAKINRNEAEAILEDRNHQVYRPSVVHPSSIEWPNLLDRPVDQYPVYNALFDIVSSWNPDNPDPPAIFRETIQHFNYSNPYEREKAALFRDAEIPFKLYDIPDVDEVVTKWSDDYLYSVMAHGSYHVEKSKNNHFMYWTLNGRGTKKFVPPTTLIHDMTFKKWHDLAIQAEQDKLSNETEHYYFMTNAPPKDRGRTFVSRDLQFLSTTSDNFFITNVDANKGIQCRFGMRGIIAEAHYDSGRNMVAMLKGKKRYIITPPSSCEKLGIITDPSHPSYRHSAVDWSNMEEARQHDFMHVPAIDTVVQQGEVLYIPSFWFHYIISLQYSIQCNSRSGTPPRHDGKRHIEECLHQNLNFDKYDGKGNSPKRPNNNKNKPPGLNLRMQAMSVAKLS